MRLATVAFLSVSCEMSAASAADRISIAPATRDPQGFLSHAVQSPYQAGTTEIRVLLPDETPPETRLPVVYVLPVEAQRGNRYGDGLVEIRKQNLHNARRAIFVAPTFSHLPWYADHPRDPAIRQETYLLKVVVPFIKSTYPASTAARDRLLLGFSKSGWGACSLLLRHSDIFGRAAAWDAPLMMAQFDRFGAAEVFATQQHFECYRLQNAAKNKAADLPTGKRLIFTGYGGFREQHQQMHELLNALNIPHEFRDGPERTHDWHSGWVPEAVDLLFSH